MKRSLGQRTLRVNRRKAAETEASRSAETAGINSDLDSTAARLDAMAKFAQANNLCVGGNAPIPELNPDGSLQEMASA